MTGDIAIRGHQHNLLSSQNPGLVAVETQIAHSGRKMSKAKQMTATVEKEMAERENALVRLRVDLETVRKAGAETEGVHNLLFGGFTISKLGRLCNRGAATSSSKRSSSL